MPVVEGLAFIKTWGEAIKMETKDDVVKISSWNKEFSIKFITEEDFKALKMSSIISNQPES